MDTQEYQIGTKAFCSKEEYDKYIEISNYIDKFCSTADILNTVVKRSLKIGIKIIRKYFILELCQIKYVVRMTNIRINK